MKALCRQRGTTQLIDVPLPTLAHPDDVRIQVAVAGVCRTDVDVATGRIAVEEPRILGHEFAGVVDEVGSNVKHVRSGDRVTVMPFLSCGQCDSCRRGEWSVCQRASMLGVHRDGAFAEYVVVPASAVYRVPEGVSFREAAYAEPIAAALAVFRAGLAKTQRGVIYSNNRFSLLVEKLFHLHSFANVVSIDANDPPPPADTYDFAVETKASTEAFAELVRIVRPRGTIVLKSRNPHPVAVSWGVAVAKEITFRCVHYGEFNHALALLAEKRLDLSDLLGPVSPLSTFLRWLAETQPREQAKLFLTPGTLPCVD